MAIDLALDDRFDVFISHRGDLGTVEGRSRFEQEIILRVTSRIQPLIGETGDDAVKNMARIAARRVAKSANRLEAIANFEAKFSEDEPETLEVTIFYDSGEQLTFDVEG